MNVVAAFDLQGMETKATRVRLGTCALQVPKLTRAEHGCMVARFFFAMKSRGNYVQNFI